jgi:hypothetical protein
MRSLGPRYCDLFDAVLARGRDGPSVGSSNAISKPPRAAATKAAATRKKKKA